MNFLVGAKGGGRNAKLLLSSTKLDQTSTVDAAKMGQTLSEPETTKHTDAGEDERFLYGVSEMQGWRLTMEDAHAHILSLGDADNDPTKKTSFFAVFDGHGGAYSRPPHRT